MTHERDESAQVAKKGNEKINTTVTALTAHFMERLSQPYTREEADPLAQSARHMREARGWK